MAGEIWMRTLHTNGLTFMQMGLMFIFGQLSSQTVSPHAGKTCPNPPRSIEINAPLLT